MSYDRTARELLKHLAAPDRPEAQPAHVAVNSRIAQQSQHSGIPRFVAATYRWLLRHDRRHRYVFFQTSRRRKIDRTETVRLPENTLGAALFDLWLVNRLARRLPSGSVFHGPSNVLPWRKRKSLRYVVTIHDLSSLVFPEQYGRVFRTYYRFAVGRALRNADLVTADSEHTKRDIERFYGTDPSKVRVVPLGVDETFLKAKRQPRKVRGRYFLSVTTHPKRKNLPTVLRAFAESEALREHTYAIAGIIPSRQVRELTALARELGVADRVRLLGFVPERELIGLYQHADFFAYPSFYEGFGLPALEAMALGCPVIASNASSLPEVVPDRAWLVDPYSVRSVRRAMEKLAALRPSARAALVRRNRAFAERFTWAETARALTEAFDEARRRS